MSAAQDAYKACQLPATAAEQSAVAALSTVADNSAETKELAADNDAAHADSNAAELQQDDGAVVAATSKDVGAKVRI